MYEHFEKVLKDKGITAYKVAQDTGVTTATLTGWKKGRYTPKNDKLKKIADYLGVTVEYLLYGGEAKDGYYLNQETAQKAQELFENSGLRMLFDAAKGSRPEDLQMAADLLKRLKETNPDG